MSSTRNFKSPGIFAQSATTTIPATPIQGVSYRDESSGTDDIGSGWPYGLRVDSKDWNQIMYLMTIMMSEIDKKGVLGWSDEVDYTAEAVTFGSDGQLYLWLQESGPGTGAGVQDPVSAPTYWAPLNQSGFTQSLAGSGWSQLPNGLIMQWGSVSYEDIAGVLSIPISFPTTFPSSAYSIAFSADSVQDALSIVSDNMTTVGVNARISEPDSLVAGGSVRYITIGA